MTLPFASTVVRVERPATGDSYEPATYSVVTEGVRAHISTPSGFERSQSGSRSDVTFRLDADPCDLTAVDRVTDEQTGEVYEVVWAKQRHGLGLEHTEAELRQVIGVAA